MWVTSLWRLKGRWKRDRRGSRGGRASPPLVTLKIIIKIRTHFTFGGPNVSSAHQELLLKGKTMELRAYTIRDTKAEAFGAPFFQKTHGEAERNFTALVRDSQSMLYKFPDDYDLYYLGTYNDADGKFTLLDAPEHLLKAALIAGQN